ncbi:MAG: DNA polymerase IV [Bacteroidota bacterium]
MDQKPTYRRIIHIDMDAFYASVEQRENPELRGKPIAVGGSRQRGVVAAASYEARKFGVRSAMPSVTAARKCPQLIFVKPRFELYKEVSNQIRAIFFEYTDLVEPLSLDEAYLDVSENKKNLPSGTLIAQEIRKKIFEQTNLTASAGVSINKFVAKVASDINKPNGMKVILPDEVEAFLEALPVQKFHGIGKVTAQKMKNMGIHTGKELKAWSEIDLLRHFGKVGRFFYKIVRGQDNRPVNPNRLRKSVGVERTFEKDLDRSEEMLERLDLIAQKLFERMERGDNFGRTLTLKIKFADFQLITRSKTLTHDIRSLEAIRALMKELLSENLPENDNVRLLGLYVSNLENEKKKLMGQQLILPFPEDQPFLRTDNLNSI